MTRLQATASIVVVLALAVAAMVAVSLWTPVRPAEKFNPSQKVWPRMEDKHAFNIPATSLGNALYLWHVQSKLLWTGDPQLEKDTPAVVGSMTSARALAALLKDTEASPLALILASGETVVEIENLPRRPTPAPPRLKHTMLKEELTFNVPPLRLDDSLIQLSEQGHFSYGIAGRWEGLNKTVPAVVGTMPLDEALGRVLVGADALGIVQMNDDRSIFGVWLKPIE